MPNNEKVYLVRYIETDQQNDHVIGIFVDKEDAINAVHKFQAYPSSWCHVQVESIPLNLFMDKDYENNDLFWESYSL